MTSEEAAHDSRRPHGVPDSLWIALTAVALLALYALPNYAFYGDTIADAADVLARRWPSRIHPHHIGASPFYWAVWQLLMGIGVSSATPLGVMSLIGRLCALGTCYQTGVLMHRSGASVGWSCVGALLFGLSFTGWSFATTGATYAPGVFCAMAIFGHLLAGDWAQDRIRIAKVMAWMLAGVAMHQLVVLTMVPLLVFAWLDAKAKSDPAPFKPVVRITGLFAAQFYLAYSLAAYFLIGGLGLPNLIRWATSFGRNPDYWFWNHIPPGVPAWHHWIEVVVESHGRLFFALPFGEWDAPVTMWGPALALQTAFPRDVSWLLVQMVVVLILWWVLAGRRVLANDPTYARVRLLTAWWTLPLFAFSTFFEPQNSYYRLYYLPPLILVLLLPMAKGPGPTVRIARAAVAVFVGLSLLLNIGYGYAPRFSPAINVMLDGLGELAELPSGPIAVTRGKGAFRSPLHNMQYFLHRPVYRAEWCGPAGEPLTPSTEGFPPALEKRWLEREAGAQPMSSPMAERLRLSREALRAMGDRVWLHDSVIGLEQQLSRRAKTPAEAPRYLRLWRPQHGLTAPVELWLDPLEWHGSGRQECGHYGVYEFSPVGAVSTP